MKRTRWGRRGGRGRAALALLALIAVGSSSSVAAPARRGWEPVPGGWVSGPVTHVKTVPFDAGGGVGATRLGKYLYVTTFRGFSIYNVDRVTDPRLLSTTPAPYVFNEQPDTDGKILLLPKDIPSPTLHIYDVRDKSAPHLLAEVALPKNDHMWTCVLACRYAYGGRGTIVDLRKPAAPRIVGDWTAGLSVESFHAIEEVAPGRILTGSRPVYFLDARRKPTHPRVLLTQQLEESGGSTPLSLARRNPPPAFLDWPNRAADRFALISTETPFSGPCSEDSGSFMTYDTRGWQRQRGFRLVDSYRIDTPAGLYTEGRSPYNGVGCTSYAFEAAPDYERSRRAAVAWFENGVRLLDISASGKLREAGGFVPVAGSSSAPIWLDAHTLYVVDMNRGIDILRVGK